MEQSAFWESDNSLERSQATRDKLVLQEWGFADGLVTLTIKNKNTRKQRRTTLDIGGSNDKRPGTKKEKDLEYTKP